MCTIAPGYLLDLIAAVHMRHPGIELQIVDAAARQLQERLIGGTLDVAIYALPALAADERLHHMALYREQFRIVLEPQPPARRRRTRAASRTSTASTTSGASIARWAGPADAVFDAQGVTGPTVYQSERDDWILAMAAAGLGYAFMPALCVEHPGVVALPLVEPEIWREVALVTVRGRPHSPAVGALVQEAMRLPWAGKPALAVEARTHRMLNRR